MWNAYGLGMIAAAIILSSGAPPEAVTRPGYRKNAITVVALWPGVVFLSVKDVVLATITKDPAP